MPPPHRGELVRLLGEVLREHKHRLGRLVMRRATNTINYGRTLPLSQGVSSDIG